MATEKLGLPTITGNMSADVVRDLNALANGVDARAGVANGLAQLGADGILVLEQRPSIPVINDASTTQKGIVQLNNTVTSTSVAQAATANAVKTAMDRADAAFTSASNGKTSIANAAGAPSISSDTFTKIASDITTGKSNIAGAIRGKGGTVNDADSFGAIASAVDGIELGKKYATGTATSSASTVNFQYAVSTTLGGFNYLTVTGLPFTPKKIILYASPLASTLRFRTLYEDGADEHYPKTAKIFQVDGDSYSSGAYNMKADVSNASVTADGFTLPVLGTSTLYTWEVYSE